MFVGSASQLEVNARQRVDLDFGVWSSAYGAGAKRVLSATATGHRRETDDDGGHEASDDGSQDYGSE
jgi:hypothetical protein